LAYSFQEKEILWDESKNELLKRTRNLSFEDIIMRIQGNDLLDTIVHPAPDRYPGQKIFVVRIEDHIVLVPFVEDGMSIFLKTIIPSRKMTKIYGQGKQHEAWSRRESDSEVR